MTTTDAPVDTVDDTPQADPPAQDRLAAAWRAVRAALADWWVWAGQPTSYREAWRQSAVDRTRLVLGAPWWVLRGWQVSNWTDRLVWFALMLIFPAGLQGPLRWAAIRPTRRLGTYLLLGLAALGAYASTKVR